MESPFSHARHSTSFLNVAPTHSELGLARLKSKRGSTCPTGCRIPSARGLPLMYNSPCDPLLLTWPEEVEGTSMSMNQGKILAAQALMVMFRVSPVLRWVPSAAVLAVAGACGSTSLGSDRCIPRTMFCGGRTHYSPLSAPAAKNRARKIYFDFISGPRQDPSTGGVYRRPEVDITVSEHSGVSWRHNHLRDITSYLETCFVPRQRLVRLETHPVSRHTI